MSTLQERLNISTAVEMPPGHLGLKWESLDARHAPSLAALIRKSQSFDLATYPTSDAAIADMVEGRTENTLISTIVGLDNCGEVQAAATVYLPLKATKQISVTLDASVSPSWRGRGLGRVLLRWQDQTARSLILQEYGPDSQQVVKISAAVAGNNDSARSLFIAAGYTPERTFDVMYADLARPLVTYRLNDEYEFHPWPEGCAVEEVRQLHQETFQDHWGSQETTLSWWDDSMDNLDRRWSCIVRDKKGELAGYCVVARPVSRWMLTGVKELYAELVGVSRSHRGKGLARAMLSHAVERAREDGMQSFGLDVDVDNPSAAGQIYTAIGFEPKSSYTYYSVVL
ncbi:GNAT family N-acetyltransferase [Boudabousia liubingyangii]|uniref:GNAT family N-acetyltransferase n=1 Tax=Boudabousia liubingyangii TaxID=1921764 RepID=UPI000939CF8B|nr:GNAT family N-acetyltransferase [Boudabousia liubingyangii]